MTFSLDEWRAKATNLFGESALNWLFQCPACKRVQTPGEFSARGISPDLAYQECLGNYVAEINCDWKAYGLFHGPDFVRTETGKEIPVFAFAAPVAQAETEKAGAVVDPAPAALCSIRECNNELVLWLRLPGRGGLEHRSAPERHGSTRESKATGSLATRPGPARVVLATS